MPLLALGVPVLLLWVGVLRAPGGSLAGAGHRDRGADGLRESQGGCLQH